MNNYTVVSITSKSVIIRDTDNGVSITNSIEKVLANIEQNYEPIGQRRFFYFDSYGELTEVIHNQGAFVDFRHVPESAAVLVS